MFLLLKVYLMFCTIFGYIVISLVYEDIKLIYPVTQHVRNTQHTTLKMGKGEDGHISTCMLDNKKPPNFTWKCLPKRCLKIWALALPMPGNFNLLQIKTQAFLLKLVVSPHINHV